MSEELQPGQLVLVNGETCKILACNHKLPSALRYTVETPDVGTKVVAASQIEEVITDAPEADADAAQREADEAISAEAAEQAEKDAETATQAEKDASDAEAEAYKQAHEAGDHTETPVSDCLLCQAEAAAGSPS